MQYHQNISYTARNVTHERALLRQCRITYAVHGHHRSSDAQSLLDAAAFKNVGVVRYVSHLLGDRAVNSGCDASDALLLAIRDGWSSTCVGCQRIEV